MIYILQTLLIIIITCMVSKPSYALDRFWEVQTIDAMKTSRDVAREKKNDTSYNQEIEKEVSEIAKTGATHIGIGVPYDPEFVPFLKRWVAISRKYKLKVWFRGNMSGWEGWYEYKKIDRKEHSKLIEEFIKKNPSLFEDGDIFTSCPECENGGPGDPRSNKDAKGHAEFLIHENELTKRLFEELGKDVKTNYYSMNGDVARLIMTKDNTEKLDGVVTIDHYVKTPEKLITDVQNYVKESEGVVVLGEWGLPVPDIHGDLTEEQQAELMDDSLMQIIKEPSIIGINYWVNKGGSTAIWNDDNSPRKGVEILTKFFKPTVVNGTITDESGKVLKKVSIESPYRSLTIDGEYSLPIIGDEPITFSKSGYSKVEIEVHGTKPELNRNIVLSKSRLSIFNWIKRSIKSRLESLHFITK